VPIDTIKHYEALAGNNTLHTVGTHGYDRKAAAKQFIAFEVKKTSVH